MDDVTIQDNHNITVIEGKIIFPEYPSLVRRAKEVRMKLESIEVTEDNVKESKKLVASVRKEVDLLESSRKEIKRNMLEPYEIFNEQVSEITSIVREGENIVRSQIRELTEREREEKQQAISDIWDKRITDYAFKNVITLEDFLKPSHLGKSISMDKIESEMVQFLTRIEYEIDTIQSMDDSKDILAEYMGVFDMAQAINTINVRKKASKFLEKELPEPSQEVATFVIKGEENIILVESFLNENNIKFIMK